MSSPLYMEKPKIIKTSTALNLADYSHITKFKENQIKYIFFNFKKFVAVEFADTMPFEDKSLIIIR